MGLLYLYLYLYYNKPVFHASVGGGIFARLFVTILCALAVVAFRFALIRLPTETPCALYEPELILE